MKHASYVHGASQQALIGQTIGQLFDEASQQYASQQALIVRHQGIRWSYAELRQQVDRLACGLLRLGLQPGDRIGIWSQNNAEWVLTQFATAKAGLVLVNINPAYRRSELEYAINKVGCRALIASPSFKSSNYIEMLQDLLPELADSQPGALRAARMPRLEWVIRMGQQATSGMLGFADLLSEPTPQELAALQQLGQTLQFDDAINIQFTSGTTGSPKGATLSHHNILNNAFFTGQAMGFGPDDRLCIPVPLYHCFGMVLGTLTCLTHGACMVFPAESFDVLSVCTRLCRVLMEVIADLLPDGVLNVVNGFGVEAGKPLATNPRIAKVAFTGETGTGRLIMQYAAENIIPVTLELGGKSPNIFFEDVMREDDDYFDKALEGFAMFALNQGEVCTCPSRVLVQESIYEAFMERAVARVQAIRQGNPLDMATMIGAQASREQLDKILSYIDIGRAEGAQVLTGGGQAHLGGQLAEGFYVQPTILAGHNKMRVFQEEIFGPVVAVTTFKDKEEALHIANDSAFGLGAGVWTRDGNTAYRMGREIKAGRVWTNCYHLYPAHAAFGGYKKSGIGRETHKMMLDHYQQTKNLLVSYSPKALGFF
ncbi:aldehyde dehydrogenase family protein [Aquitalea magnusonii]|uniref:aldehyde dehydrogenase family protein n=1 Tax=Aquitalea magnusonii TaxID=332411 RepID=UPI0009EB724F|nr:aldehyde dehydrogenase family protein [Aquitalea magnusonii]